MSQIDAMAKQLDAAHATEIERLRAALEEIVALEPEKKRHSQHEHHIAMLKALDIARKALANEAGK